MGLKFHKMGLIMKDLHGRKLAYMGTAIKGFEWIQKESLGQ